jgi:glycosyltransferase 2 family protein
MNLSFRRPGPLIRPLFGMVGLVFLAITFWETWNRSHQRVLPSGLALGGAALLGVVVLAFAGRSWASLLSGRAPRVALARGFYVSQLGKYVPGAIWQAVGQIGLAQRAGVDTSLAVTAFPVHAITQATAGGTIGAGLLLFGWNVPLRLRIVSLSGLLLLPLLQRSWMVRVLNALGRVTKRTWPDELVPPQRSIVRSYAWASAALLVAGLGFTLIASSVHAETSAVASVPAFAVAWTVGFLALPFPSGVGIREAVLIAVLARPGSTAPMIAASLAHRAATISAEASMILWVSIRGRRVPPDSRSPGGPPGDSVHHTEDQEQRFGTGDVLAIVGLAAVAVLVSAGIRGMVLYARRPWPKLEPDG